MKIAIISDIHGNLEALTEVVAYLDTHPVGALYCLGDTIGYGANPNECCQLVRRRNAVSLLGNHDNAVWDDEMLASFSPLAAKAMLWTRTVLHASEKTYLQSLPLIAMADESTFVHASLDDPASFPYLMSVYDARLTLKLSTTTMCWIGHTHVPAIFSEHGETSAVVKGTRYVVNVGSVGQPRDADPRLSFGIFDTERGLYENIRLPYDVKTACRKIIDAGLPARLGERLLVGH
jgi:diadenosine tetraphosphatase ApaH/serine/threonine PP2A family protein phosphatase